MIKRKSEFLEYILNDVLGHVTELSSKSMFGGYGIYQKGIIFALIAYDQLYFKVGTSNQSDYVEMGSKPFTYQRKNHLKTTMSYWLVPEEIMDNKDEIVKWVDKSVQASKSSRKK